MQRKKKTKSKKSWIMWAVRRKGKWSNKRQEFIPTKNGELVHMLDDPIRIEIDVERYNITKVRVTEL